MGDLGCQNIKTRTQRNLVVFHLNLFLITSILNYSFYFFDLLLELFDVNETVCILLFVQIWRGVEGARLECHFAEFWAAKQMAGSFSGTARYLNTATLGFNMLTIAALHGFILRNFFCFNHSDSHVSCMYTCFHMTNFTMLLTCHLFVSWFSLFSCTLNHNFSLVQLLSR
jgi:hypothetical protein